MEKRFFGRLPSGEAVSLYILKNGEATLTLSDYGARVVGLEIGGVDIVGGFDSVQDYLADTSHQGGTIGRVANRIGGARFTMDGKEYSLPKHDGENCLHGGKGYDRNMWRAAELSDDRCSFAYSSADGEEGFPSGVEVKVSYTLIGGAVKIDYCATPDGKTPIALTNHSYFNLNGFGKDIKGHRVRIYADRYTEVGDDLIPNGNRPTVCGTALDFRDIHTVGERLSESFVGYDHNYILSPEVYRDFSGKRLALAAEVWGDSLKMEVWTDQPGLQFYIGNFLGEGPDFKGGIPQIRHGALCLETQTEPNCINHGTAFYGAGDVYSHTTLYKVEKI